MQEAGENTCIGEPGKASAIFHSLVRLTKNKPAKADENKPAKAPQSKG